MTKPLSLRSISILAVAFLFCSVTTTFSQTYNGQAFAVSAKVTAAAQPVVTTAIADTGDLPTAGGNISLTSVGVTLPGGLVSVGSSTTSTAGGPAPGSLSQSTASVNNLNIGIPGAAITAAVVSSTTSCSCPGSVSTGSSTITNLVIAGNPITVTGEANQSVVLALSGSRTLTVVINQQLVWPRSITVNALSITLQEPVIATSTQIVVASASSGINCLTPAVTNVFTGRGTSVRLKQATALLGDISTIISDTGPLPTVGGDVTSTTTGAGITGLLSTGVTVSRTSGGLPGGNADTTQSDSEVDNLSVTVANTLPFLPSVLALNASVVRSETQCVCTLAMPSCTGSSTLTGLNVSVLGVNVPITITGLPNQIVNITVPGGLGNITLTINERSSAGSGDLTVNALRIQLDLLPTLLVATNIVVSQSHSGIFCAVQPTSAQVSVSGRVITKEGQGLRNANVTLADSDGNILQVVRTGGFGYFNFDGVEVGRSYVLSVNSKQYSVEPVLINVMDEINNIELIAYK